jgi:membrane fusion protein (multidrug efflux system)
MAGMEIRATGRRLAYAATVALATLVGSAAGFAQAPAPLPGLTPPPAPAPQGPVGVAPEIRAQLTPRQFTTLSSEMAARVDRIATKVGDHFQKGDVLIEFDCAVPRAQEQHARAVQMQAEKTYTIDQRLVALRSMGQLELDVAAAEVEKDKADVAAAVAITSKCTIAAPFSGITVDQKARAFQYTTPGQPLLDILDDHGLEIELIAPSRWLSWLKTGYAFEVHIDETGKTYPAKITRLSGRVDPISQSVKVIGEITGDAPELMAGMSGRATITPP